MKDRLLNWRLIGCLAVLAALAWLAGRGLPDGRLHVYFLDVGQGDAVFVRMPDGHEMLIDGGPSPAALLSQVGALMPFWDHSLDLVVLTHADSDHMAGLLPMLERYRVQHVLDSARAAAEPAAASWRARLPASGHMTGQTGLRLAAGASVLTVVHTSGAGSASSNDDSLVLRLDYGQTSFLFTGDAEGEAETEMLSGQVPLRADVLKVGHHGSAASTTAPFLAAVAPRLAVIQVGADNRFGHPAPALLARLAGIPTLRTDRDGRIEVISDGRQLWVKTSQGEQPLLARK